MPTLTSILRVLNAFRVLDRPYYHIYSISYPGKFHSVSELSAAAGLPRTTVRDVVVYLQSISVVESKSFDRVRFRLLVWEFELPGGVRVEVELDRVVAYVS